MRMRVRMSFVALLAVAMATSAVAGDEAQAARFVADAKQALHARDAQAFGALYCEPVGVAADLGWLRGRTLTDVRIEPANPAGEPSRESLAICYEGPNTKETCVLEPLQHVGARICLVNAKR